MTQSQSPLLEPTQARHIRSTYIKIDPTQAASPTQAQHLSCVLCGLCMQASTLTYPKLQMPVFGRAKTTPLTQQNAPHHSSRCHHLKLTNKSKLAKQTCSQTEHAQESVASCSQFFCCMLLTILMQLELCLEVDQGLQLGECLHCICLHTSCILEELQGIALLNVLTFDQLTQEWFDQTIKG